MFEKIVDTVANNKNSCMYSLLGASLLAGYFCLGRDMLSKHYGVQLRRNKNLLDTSFQELYKANKQPNIMKIVFTEADKSSGNYRKMVIEKIKDTFPNMGFGVLINCSVYYFLKISRRNCTTQGVKLLLRLFSTTMKNTSTISSTS